MFYVLLCVTLFSVLVLNNFDVEERAGRFALFVFLVSRDCCVALPHDVTVLSAVCDCVFFLIILTILTALSAGAKTNFLWNS